MPNSTDILALVRLRRFFNAPRLEMLWWVYLGIWCLELLANFAPIIMYQHAGGIMSWLTFLLVPLYMLVRLAVVRLLIEVALILLADPRPTPESR